MVRFRERGEEDAEHLDRDQLAEGADDDADRQRGDDDPHSMPADTHEGHGGHTCDHEDQADPQCTDLPPSADGTFEWNEQEREQRRVEREEDSGEPLVVGLRARFRSNQDRPGPQFEGGPGSLPVTGTQTPRARESSANRLDHRRWTKQRSGYAGPQSSL